MTGFSLHLAQDLAQQAVRVNAVAPGSVRTAMSVPPYTEPEEIAASVCLLLSGEARVLTGHVLVTDDGHTVT